MTEYTITDEQIDAAWKFADRDDHTACSDRNCCDGVDVLEILHIFRCEGCGGSGETDVAWRTRCPDCNGHGWVKEECGGHEWIKTSVDPNKDGQNGTDDG